MLIQCSRCGKPVFFPDGRDRAECGYCYTCNNRTAAELKPEMIDWKRPLFDAIGSLSNPGDACAWLVLLGDYEDAPQRLERSRARVLEQIRESEEQIETAADIRQAEQIIRYLKEIGSSAGCADAVDGVLSAAREKLLRLRETREAALRERLDQLKTSIAEQEDIWALDSDITELQTMRQSPERDVVLLKAYEIRALLLQRHAEEIRIKTEILERRDKLWTRIKWILVALAVIAEVAFLGVKLYLYWQY